MSVKDLNAVAAQAKEMADHMKSAAEAAAGMAAAVQVIVDDCAAQLREQRNAASDADRRTETAAPATENPAEVPAGKVKQADMKPAASVAQLKEQGNAASDTDRRTEAAGPATEEPTEASAGKITQEKLRAFVADRINPITRPKIKELLNGFGVKKITELPEEHYAELMERVSKL